jgi:hypothetical protein
MEESSPGFPAKLLMLLVALSRLLQVEISYHDALSAGMCGSQGYFIWLRVGGRDQGECNHLCLKSLV